jgi:hypothetical protein
MGKMMYTTEEIYICFRQAQAKILNRPYRLPKDFNQYVATKMTPTNQEYLARVTASFNTRWQNIDPSRYFECGFELFKTFTYTMFFSPKVISLYIERDKNLKRETGQVKENIIQSAKFVKSWLKEKDLREDLSPLSQYCRMTVDGIKAPIKHFILNNIDKYFIVWLIHKKLLNPTPEEEGLLPLVCQNYRIYLDDIEKVKDFLVKLEKNI